MGKKPVVGLVGLLSVSVTLSGCCSTRNKNATSTYHPDPTYKAQVSATGANGAATASVGGTTGASGTAVGGSAAGTLNTGTAALTGNASGGYYSATGAGGASGSAALSGSPMGGEVKVSGAGSYSGVSQTSIPSGATSMASGGASAAPGATPGWGAAGTASAGVTSPGALTSTSNQMRTTDLGANAGPDSGTGGLGASPGVRATGALQQASYSQDNLGAAGSSGTPGGFNRMSNASPYGSNVRSAQTDNLGGDGNMMPRTSASSGLDAMGGRSTALVPLPPATPSGSMNPMSGLTPPARPPLTTGDATKSAGTSSATYSVPAPVPGAALPALSSSSTSSLPGSDPGSAASTPPSEVPPPSLSGSSAGPSSGPYGPLGAPRQ